MLEADYAYTASDGTCTFSAAQATDVGVSIYMEVTAKSVVNMKAAVAKQPVSVSIEADQRVFQQYTSGIFDSSACGTSLDHATLVVGYGEDAGTEYWIMKNSWGTSWGEAGYMKLLIEDGSGICGIQIEPLYPTVN